MKKLLLLITTLCALSTQAQVFVGGTGRIGYADDTFVLGIVPEVGYEFTERWAAGAALGMSFAATDGAHATLGVAEPFVRFTAWQNERIALDVKAIGEMMFNKQMQAAEIGLRPSVRFFINEHLDANIDFGLVGASYNGYDWSPAFLFSGMSAQLGIAYKF